MLFHIWGDSAISFAATLYFARATSKSPCDCIMDPAASMAAAWVGSNARAVPSCSKARE